MSADDANVYVVVPTRNNLAEVERCVESLNAQSRPPTRILVCVDGSTDGTIEATQRRSDASSVPISTLTHEGNAHRGRSATRNLALAELAEPGYAWFVDSDMMLVNDALDRHLETVCTRASTSVGSVIYDNADAAIWAGYLNGRGRHRYQDGAELPFTQFTTANSLVDASDLIAIGGFDERFGGYGGEDLDLAIRLQEYSGKPFLNSPGAAAHTVEDKTISQALEQFRSYGANNIPLLERLHPNVPRTFELERMHSRKAKDRVFSASMNRVTDVVADALVRTGPQALRNQALNYKVVRAVWAGYQDRVEPS